MAVMESDQEQNNKPNILSNNQVSAQTKISNISKSSQQPCARQHMQFSCSCYLYTFLLHPEFRQDTNWRHSSPLECFPTALTPNPSHTLAEGTPCSTMACCLSCRDRKVTQFHQIALMFPAGKG